MPFGAEPLVLTEQERQELQQMTQSRTLPAGDVMRSRMILLLAEGIAYQKIQDLLDTTAPTIVRWKRRFLQHRIAGLMEELHPGQPPSVRTPKLQRRYCLRSRKDPKMARRTGRAESWQASFTSARTRFSGFWCKPMCARIGWSATWPATIRILRPRPPMCSDCIWLRRSTRPCFAWMRKRRSRLWTASIQCFRYRQGGWSGTALNIDATAHQRGIRRLPRTAGLRL